MDSLFLPVLLKQENFSQVHYRDFQNYFYSEQFNVIFELSGTNSKCCYFDSGMALPDIDNSEQALYAIGAVGAIIMPHNFYLHSALVKTRS